MIPAAPIAHVSDTVHAMHPTARAAVEAELKRYQEKTGKQIVVYIGDTTGNEPLSNYTVAAAQQWKIGQKGKDNGAVLFIFTQDHRARIEVGYGLEGRLTDARSASILNDTLLPDMRRGDVDSAVEDSVAGMLGTLDPDFPVVKSPGGAATAASKADIAAYIHDDYSPALQPSVAASVAAELKRFEKKSGKWIFIHIDSITDEDSMDSFAAAYAKKQDIGKKNRPDAALIIFMQNRRGRIVVGPDLASTFPDAQIAAILDKNVTANMRHEDLDDAVQYGINGMIAQIDPDFQPTTPLPSVTSYAVKEDNDDDGSAGAGITAIIVFLIFAGILFSVILTIVRRGKRSGNWTDAFLMSSAMGPSDWNRQGGFSGHTGGGGGGGGFSGGGGSFGGGGASGGW